MTPRPRPVGYTVRVFCAAATVLGLWQVGWIADQSSRLGERLPAPWSPTFWIAAWSLVAVNALALFGVVTVSAEQLAGLNAGLAALLALFTRQTVTPNAKVR